MRMPSRSLKHCLSTLAGALCALVMPGLAFAQGVTVTVPPGTAPLPEVVLPNDAPPAAEKPKAKPKPPAKPAGDGSSAGIKPGGDGKNADVGSWQ